MPDITTEMKFAEKWEETDRELTNFIVKSPLGATNAIKLRGLIKDISFGYYNAGIAEGKFALNNELGDKAVTEEKKSEKRSCNRHDDCTAADAKVKAQGGFAADHCHDEGCEECFGN